MWARGLIVLVLLVPPCVDAQVYRWVDEEGRVHYSDQRPPGREVDDIPIQTRRTDPAEVQREGEARRERLDGASERRATASESAAREAEHRASRERGCTAARARLENLQNARRLWREDGQGGRQHLDEGARERELQDARAMVAEWCR